jgi:hypothetical protein
MMMGNFFPYAASVILELDVSSWLHVIHVDIIEPFVLKL